MKLQICIPMLLALVALAPKADAGVMLSLSSTSDLASLEVGDTIVVDVELSGLTGALSFLGADVTIPDQFATTPNASFGSIVPAGAETFLDPTSVPQLVFGQSFAFGFPFDPATFIMSDGTFFSFELEVVAEGSGSIDFFSAIAFAPGPQPDFIPETEVLLQTSSLPFNAGSSVVPEPASIAGFLMLGVVALGYRKKRQARREEGLHA